MHRHVWPYVAAALALGAVAGWIARSSMSQNGDASADPTPGVAMVEELEPEGPPPALVSLLEEDPELLTRPLEADIVKGGTQRAEGKSVRVDRVTFTSHVHRGEPVRIFGYYARPQNADEGKAPGLVMLHGGGGRGTSARAARGAANGFASISIDLPGRGEGREQCRSTGPDMTVENLFATGPELSDCYLHHAALAALRSAEFLRQQPGVDGDRVALYGVSWGGATSLIAGGLDERLAGVVDLFGSGHIPGGSIWDGYLQSLDVDQVATWEANFDPARYARRIAAPLLMVTGTNDGCYSLPRFLRTRETAGGDAHMLLRPDLNHRIDIAADRMIWAWLRAVVRDGIPVGDLPRFTGVRVTLSASRKSATVSLAVGGKFEATNGTLAYCAGGAGWAKKDWSEVELRRTRSGRLEAEIPLADTRAYVFGTARCANGMRISTPVHTFVGATVNGQRRLYHVPYVPPWSIELPLRELAVDLGLDGDEVGARGLAIVDKADVAWSLQPRARVIEGKLYVAHAEVAELTGAESAWLWDGPAYRMNEGH